MVSGDRGGAPRADAGARSELESPRTIAITRLPTFPAQRLPERLPAHDPKLRLVGIDLRRPYRLEGRVRFHRADLTDPTADGRLAEIFEKERVERSEGPR